MYCSSLSFFLSLSFARARSPLSQQNSVLYPSNICMLGLFFLFSSSSSSTRFHLMASRKSCSLAGKTRFFFFLLLLLLVDTSLELLSCQTYARAHIDVVVVITSSSSVVSSSLAHFKLPVSKPSF